MLAYLCVAYQQPDLQRFEIAIISTSVLGSPFYRQFSGFRIIPRSGFFVNFLSLLWAQNLNVFYLIQQVAPLTII